MARYLLLKLEGVLQAWGGHTFEDVRPSELFPTRSGLLGLLAACCGISRTQRDALQALAESVLFSVRIDSQPLKMIDYHTVKNARDSYAGLKSHDTIQSWREYLQNANYTVAISNTTQATVSLDQLKHAVQKPIYTPYLGRRSCPITRPLYADDVEAEHALAALACCEPDRKHNGSGTIYTEEEHALFINKPQQLMRDVPIASRKRQFATRTVRILAGERYGTE